jgi:hypothetical protein
MAWAMLGLAVYLLSREFGARPFYSMAAASLILSIPMIMDRVNTLHIDLPLASIFLVSLYFAYSSYKTRSPVEFSLCIASLGLLIGIKPPGIVYAALIGAFWGALEMRRSLVGQGSSELLDSESLDKMALNPVFAEANINLSESNKTRLASFLSGRSLLLFGWLCFLLLSSFWYIRNYMELQSVGTGIPIKVAATNLASFPTTAGSNGIFQKLQQLYETTLAHEFNPSKLSHWKALASQTVARLQLPFIAMLLQVFLLPYVVLKFPRKSRQPSFIGLLVLLLLSGFLYWITPLSAATDGPHAPGELSPLFGYNFRYGFPFVAVLAVTTAVMATITQTSRSLVLIVVWLSGILGVLSWSLFNSIRTNNFSGTQGVWLSSLIQKLPSDPGKVMALVFQSMGQSLLEILLYMIIFVSMILLVNRGVFQGKLPTPQSTRHLSVFKKNNRSLLAVLSIVLMLSLISTAQLIRDGNRTNVYGGIYAFLDSHVNRNQKIAYFDSYRNYLFYGKNLDKPVLHRLPIAGDPDKWINDLRRDGAWFVATGPFPYKEDSERGRFFQPLIAKGVVSPTFGKVPAREIVIFRLPSDASRP